VEEVGEVDVLVAPIGGGGGMAGYATAVKALCPSARVVGVEAEASGVNKRSLAAGRRLSIDIPRTIADGQQLTTPGAYPFEVMRERVDEVVLVADAEMVEAMVFLFDRLKLVTEPSGAIATAALLCHRVTAVEGQRIGVMVTGGNVGAGRFASLVM
jgi:threonine dehydratase